MEDTYTLAVEDSGVNAEVLGNATSDVEGPAQEEQRQSRVVFRDYKGTVIGPNDMDEIESMEIREDDVFAVSFPRSGTTLTQELIYLTSTGDFETARTVLLDDRFPFLDLVLDDPNYPYFRGVNFIREKKSPRFIKSHIHHFLLPKQLRDGKGKIVYIARNPRDVVVSYFKLQKWYRREKRDFEEFFENFLAGRKLLCGPWWRHVKEAWGLRDKPNILFLIYEDIITDIPGTVNKLCHFLGKSRTEEEIARITEHCQIENMKKNSATNGKYQAEFSPKDTNYGNFINTGKVGAVEGYYTDEMLQRLRDKYEEEFKDTGLCFPTFP